MLKSRRLLESILAFVLLVTNSRAWTVISKLSDVQFLYTVGTALKPMALASVEFVRDWGWVAGLGLLAHVAYDSVKHHQPAAGDREGVTEEMASLAEYRAIEQQLHECQKQVISTRAIVDEKIQREDEVRGQLGRAEAALKAKRREFAEYILRRHSGMTFNNGQQPATVTIRYVGHGPDMDLVEKLERILSEFCNWEPTRDGKNDPALPRAKQFKVVFESAATTSFDDLSFAFTEGDLLDGISVGKRMGDRHDSHHLIIQILP